jgi:hypothetical protein
MLEPDDDDETLLAVRLGGGPKVKLLSRRV